MKAFLRIALCCFVYVLFGNYLSLYASDENDFRWNNRHYVSHESVKVTDTGILVVEDGEDVSIKKLFVDSHGRLYYKTGYKAKGYLQPIPCGRGCGPFFGRNCPRCGWPNEDKRGNKRK
jgi:hypothetical protein